MPTYEYKCKDCEEGFEVVQAFTDDALTECPSCHGDLKKVFGSIGISFKGSGFYKNDARSGSKSSSSSTASTDSGDSSTSSSDASSTSDTKTEAKPKKEPTKKKSEKTSA
ncbi:MAG TPA: FmdB family zinc ribbon protein [Acidimicrobiales bacterium]|nr:FmdB family zinc ribbon protein [Acidimicrobiales bacterium]